MRRPRDGGEGPLKPDEFLLYLNDTTVLLAADETIDPATITNKRLTDLGLPPQPDRRAEPKLWQLWSRFFSPKVTFLNQKFTLSASGRALRHSRAALAFPSSPTESSLNWSGAYVTPNHGRRFTDIYGIWQVPAVTIPAQGPLSPTGWYYSSIFIGLDGQRRYKSDSLPQVGTRQDIDPSGTIFYETWWEWFARDQGGVPTKTSLQVKPGETVMCWLTVLSPTQVRCMIRNLDHPSALAFFHCPLSPIQPRAIPGLTAEWIVERPTNPTTGVIETLPDYGGMEFQECFALADGVTAGPHLQDLTGSRLIRMKQQRPSPWRSTLVSEPARIKIPPFVDETAFTVAYRPGL